MKESSVNRNTTENIVSETLKIDLKSRKVFFLFNDSLNYGNQIKGKELALSEFIMNDDVRITPDPFYSLIKLSIHTKNMKELLEYIKKVSYTEVMIYTQHHIYILNIGDINSIEMVIHLDGIKIKNSLSSTYYNWKIHSNKYIYTINEIFTDIRRRWLDNTVDTFTLFKISLNEELLDMSNLTPILIFELLNVYAFFKTFGFTIYFCENYTLFIAIPNTNVEDEIMKIRWEKVLKHHLSDNKFLNSKKLINNFNINLYSRSVYSVEELNRGFIYLNLIDINNKNLLKSVINKKLKSIDKSNQKTVDIFEDKGIGILLEKKVDNNNLKYNFLYLNLSQIDVHNLFAYNATYIKKITEKTISKIMNICISNPDKVYYLKITMHLIRIILNLEIIFPKNLNIVLVDDGSDKGKMKYYNYLDIRNLLRKHISNKLSLEISRFSESNTFIMSHFPLKNIFIDNKLTQNNGDELEYKTTIYFIKRLDKFEGEIKLVILK